MNIRISLYLLHTMLMSKLPITQFTQIVVIFAYQRLAMEPRPMNWLCFAHVTAIAIVRLILY